MRLNSLPVIVTLMIGSVSFAACATTRTDGAAGPASEVQSGQEAGPATTAADPRVGLRAGWLDAEEAIWNLRLVSETPKPDLFVDPADPGAFDYFNSDIAFFGDHAVQGNFYGFQIWDISDPAAPTLVTVYECPGSQNDVSVHGNLLFTSVEALSGRVDCGPQGVQDTVSAERMRGVRIFDIGDLESPELIANVQTCRGSHTHTLVPDAEDPENLYVYVSGSAPVRSPSELAGCVPAPPEEDPESSLLRIDVIQVPLAAPETARVVSSPRIFAGLETPPIHPEPGDTAAAAPQGAAPDQCHDITVYPAMGIAAGACQGHGLLLDISDVPNPTRVDAVIDRNFAYWHSATFDDEATTVIFTDEWGGGLQPKCRATDPYEWGANALFTRTADELTFESYYKLPVPQTPEENCVAHNGSLIPVPGRDIMVQAWYQGGISIFDFTDPANPYEIAFFDRWPVDSTRMAAGGSWSAYWYNGKIYSSEIARGLDVLELVPSEHLSENEIAAAELVELDVLNVQTQPRYHWPDDPVVARALLDQLERAGDLKAELLAEARRELDRIAGLSGGERVLAATALATRLASVADESGDPDKVRDLVRVVEGLMRAGD